jgi:hypothetical protein
LASSATFAPSRAARRAIARPMPRLPPDIRMVRPASGLGSWFIAVSAAAYPLGA